MIITADQERKRGRGQLLAGIQIALSDGPQACPGISSSEHDEGTSM